MPYGTRDPYEIIQELEAAREEYREREAGHKATITTLQAKLTEALELIREALNDDDFKPCFDAKNHKTGPALRGTLERVEGALCAVQQEEED